MPGMANGAAVFRRSRVTVSRRSPSRLRGQHAACNQQHQSQLPKVSAALSHSFDYIEKYLPYPSAKVVEVEEVVVACRRDRRPNLHRRQSYNLQVYRNHRRRPGRRRFRLR